MTQNHDGDGFPLVEKELGQIPPEHRFTLAVEVHLANILPGCKGLVLSQEKMHLLKNAMLVAVEVIERTAVGPAPTFVLRTSWNGHSQEHTEGVVDGCATSAMPHRCICSQKM